MSVKTRIFTSLTSILMLASCFHSHCYVKCIESDGNSHLQDIETASHKGDFLRVNHSVKTEGSTVEAVGPNPEVIYKHLFKHKRADQVAAVKRIFDLKKYEKQYKMVNLMLEKIFQVLQDAHVSLTEAGYMPGDPFPTDEVAKTNVATVVENTALFAEMALRLPDIVHRIYDKNYEWKTQISWAFLLCESSNLFDGANGKLLHLAAQEIGFREKEPSFINPYSSEYEFVESLDEEQLKKELKKQKKAENKKKRKNRGPRLSGGHIEL